ncbi:MAG: NifU family protein [Rhodospirillaceae bacterium]|nr:NifU family protein [Rhodospirillaceae bacterium]
MFIQTEDTPNPSTLKFLPGKAVMASGTADFTNQDDAERSPLAHRLFDVAHVEGVFLGGDFVSVTKSEGGDWQLMKPTILGVIMEHFIAGRPVIEGEGAAAEETYANDDAEVVGQIKELLDTRVRPAVAQDGGDIVFRSYQNGIVSLTMQGACQGCPSSTMTLKMGIENLLKHYIPEVIEVRPVM